MIQKKCYTTRFHESASIQCNREKYLKNIENPFKKLYTTFKNKRLRFHTP